MDRLRSALIRPTTLLLTGGLVIASIPLDGAGQHAPDRVLVRTTDEGPQGPLEIDRGASELWQRLQKARTTASVMYTTGHPDDEEAGVLTLLSRGMGVRTALLSLNRGEGGANAIGSELFDALGLIRTEELRLAGRYYGLDDQYFTTAADYGFSKTLDEAMRSWDREALLGDMVRIIRINRPLVVISRWHGDERDGHGHHQTAGVLTPEAVEAAADMTRFPEQIRDEGLRPWRVRKLMRGRVLADEPADVELDPWAYDDWLGTTYQDFAAYGLSLQRSQTSGRQRTGTGPGAPARYDMLPAPAGPAEPGPIFDGLDTSISGIGTVARESLDPTALAALSETQAHVDAAVAAFDPEDVGEVVPHLVAALRGIRRAGTAVTDGTESTFLIAIEERRVADALETALGLSLSATAVPAGADAAAPMGPAVPGASLDVHVLLIAAGRDDVRLTGLAIASRAGWVSSPWTPVGDVPVDRAVSHTLGLRIPDDGEPTRPWFQRPDISHNQYVVRDSAEMYLGESRPRAEAIASLEIDGVAFEVRAPVTTLESAAPYAVLRRPLAVAPVLSLAVSPGVVVPRPPDDGFEIEVAVTANAPDLSADISLDLPRGWIAPTRHVDLDAAGRTESVRFPVTPSAGARSRGDLVVGVVARSGDQVVREGYETIEHRDLQTKRLYHAATVRVAWVDVAVATGLEIGYVMGVGDDVPAAIEQLGASVTLLEAADLSDDDLSRFDAVVVGTRAYAVRADLVAANGRLLDYARRGGHVVVLYQTPEYRPEEQAPFTATLPGNAEEVSEEDAPVTILAPEHPLLTAPNRIAPGDFDGWIEQRGSKFFATWSDRYTPLVETHDTGQTPQEGVWLAADVGEGSFTYVSLALHRQLPYGVHGAWRILANLISQGR